MSEVFGIFAGRGLAALDSARLRIVLITLAILVVLAVLGVEFVSAIHPHMAAHLAGGQAWVEKK